MTKSSLSAQVAFLLEVEKLKSVQRANRTVDGRRENSAEHSWHVALMAVLLQEHAASSLDMYRVVKMLLIHDLVEVDAGDTWLFGQERKDKELVEDQAARRLFSMLPGEQEAEFLGLWYEFESGDSEEAKFAQAIDGIQPLLNHVLTGSTSDGVVAVDEVRAKKLYISRYAPALWELVEELIQQSVNKGLYA
ncbi:MAG: HD domain-containing protein [Pseudomonadota bacterium]